MFILYQNQKAQNLITSLAFVVCLSLFNFQIKPVIGVTTISVLFDLSVSLDVGSQQKPAAKDQLTVLTPEKPGQLDVLLFLRESLTVF